jgi:hypothetical protein
MQRDPLVLAQPCGDVVVLVDGVVVDDDWSCRRGYACRDLLEECEELQRCSVVRDGLLAYPMTQ